HRRGAGERVGRVAGSATDRGQRGRLRIHVARVAHRREGSTAKLAPRGAGRDDPRVIRLACPSGCAVKVQIPFRLRAEPVRCRNCTAWFRAPAAIEDGGYLEGELLARPGAGEPLWRPPPARSLPWRWLAAGTLLAAGVAVAGRAPGPGGPVPPEGARHA